MRDGWYDVIDDIGEKHTLLYYKKKWWKDYPDSKYLPHISEVMSEEPKFEMTVTLDCEPDRLQDLLTAIYEQAAVDLKKALVFRHYHPDSNEGKYRIVECKRFLKDYEIRGQHVIPLVEEGARYEIFRTDHGCKICREKECPHSNKKNEAFGSYSAWKKGVGCLKDETDNS